MSEGSPVNKSETAKREEEILEFWRKDGTFEKSLAKPAPKGEYVFYDGPPFATGLPHHGSLLSSIIKDVIPRYKTMRGYRVRRRWGWDTHGLPIENLVEKELGLKSKKDIEKIGIAKFNQTARSMVLRYVHDWKAYVERVGRWVDYENSYKTMDNTFIESVWWGLKQLWDKGLLYEGRKVLMYCPHDETPLAKAEIAADNTYKNITEEAVTVKFELIDEPGTFFLAWTTTPWTLPGNVGLAVGADITYVKIKTESGIFILAKDRVGAVIKDTYEVVEEMLGKKISGSSYKPLFDISALKSSTAYKVWVADFVTTTDGTGIVHTAVMYGEDDYKLGEREKLPMVQMLNANGTYNDVAPEFIRGKYIKEAEKDIKRDLQERGLLFARENHTHSYPHCWRCGTPLIYNAVPSWFINIQKVKAKMLSENEKVNWVPDHLKHGRFYNIVDNAPDWTISRNRFWASPLPIWKSKDGKVMVVGSLDEIKKHSKSQGNTYLVMRHGEAEQNVKNIVFGGPNDNFALTEEGEKQVRESADTLKGKGITKIFSSPLRRAKETAHIVADTLGISRSEIIFDNELREFDFGDFNGKPFRDFVQFRDSKMMNLEDALPNGESYLDGKRRFGKWLYTADKSNSNETVLIITHGIGVESLLAAAQGMANVETRTFIRESQFKFAQVHDLAFTPLPVNDDFELDLHRPYTDGIVLIGEGGEEYRRIPEVVDCWVESGSMPFAEYHYPFENKHEFEKRAPGDFIAEYIAQTRTWFYYMHAMGVLLFDRLAFKNVATTGTILAADGEKISKSKRNYTDPLALIDQYGSDAMRLYLMGSPVMQAEDLRFRDEDVRDAHNRVIGMLWNTYKFFDLYKNEYDGKTRGRSSTHILDRWVFERLDQVVSEVTRSFDAYDMPQVCRTLRVFVDEYSTWYVRRSRERMKNDEIDKQFALATQREVLLTVATLFAPITPFISDAVHRGITGQGSVHLENWPETHRLGLFARFFGNKKSSVVDSMQLVRATVTTALEQREKAGFKIRQPLATVYIPINSKIPEECFPILADELNVKKVEKKGEVVTLDTNISEELRQEGVLREARRALQGARKIANMKPNEIATSAVLKVSTQDESILKLHIHELKEMANIKELQIEAQETIRGGNISAIIE